MENKKIAAAFIPTVIISIATASIGFAEQVPMTPELAAKREMVRKQEEQRITQDKRKAAAEALKAERLKVYRAKESLQQKQNPPATESK